jgi:poly(A) polymerase
MLRAVRFASKLDFRIESNTEAPIHELAYLLTHVPAARLFDETLKLFLSGFGSKSLELLQRYHLLEPLFPKVGALLRHKPDGAQALLLQAGLASTDLRVTADKPVTPTFLFAILFYGPVIERAVQLQDNGQPETLALFNACEEIVREQQARVSIPRRFTLPMREMFTLQPRFRRREGKKALSLLHHPRFRAAYDLLLLRTKVGAEDAEIAKWWTDVQSASAAEREAMVRPAGAPHASGARRPRRRRRRRRSSTPT